MIKIKLDKFSQGSQLALLGAAVSLAPLQVSAAIMEEVIVTAQKIEQNAQDIPLSVTAFSGAQLAEQNITDVFDLQQSSPGLVVRQNQNATTSNFSIRGVGTSGSNFGLESSVGLYVDGVYRARQNSMINEMVDMERVEVLRGPQGTLFGRNSPSGAVLMYTKAPEQEFGGYIDVAAGNYDLYSVNGAVGGALIEDVLAYRLTGFTSQRDGYVDDLAFGDDILNDRDRQGFRGQLLFTPSEEFSARIILDYATTDEKCCTAVTVRNNYQVYQRDPITGNFAANPSPFGTDSILSVATDMNVIDFPISVPGFGATIIDQSRVFDDVVAYNIVPISESKDRGISAELNWDMAGGTLTSISGYRKYDSDDLFDVDFSDATIATRDEHAKQEAFTQELRFSKTFERGNFLVGAYYFQQDLDTLSNLELGADANNFIALSVFSDAQTLLNQGLLFDALELSQVASAIVLGLENVGGFFAGSPLADLPAGYSGIGFPEGSLARNSMKQEHDAWAIFGQFDYEFAPEWRLTFGLRYTKESKDLVGTFTEPGASWGVLLNLDDLTVINPRANVDETLDDEQVTGNIKLSWLLNNNIMLYGSYATGYKSGGTNTDRINPVFDTIFDAETSESVELGMKAEFPEQALRVNLALHHTITRDYQTNSFQGNGFNLSNAGEVKTRGAELEVLWQATDNLEITGVYVYNRGEFKGFERANCWIAYSLLTGIQDPGRANPTDQFCDRSGDPLDSNPLHTYMLAVTQNIPINDGLRASLHADYNHRGSQFQDGNIDPYKKEDPYGVLNLRFGLQFTEYDLAVNLWARNVLNQNYLATYTDAPLQDGKLMAYATEPRTYGISLTKNF